MVEPGDYVTDEKYAFTETIDVWLHKYSTTPLNKTKWMLIILSKEFNEQHKFVTLPFTSKKEAVKIFKLAQKLFKHPSIKKATFSLAKVVEFKVYEASNPN